MEVKELRIGNHVNYIDCIGDKKQGIITKVQTKYVEADDYWNIIEPIPLTEEWLINFGFNNSLVNDIFLHNKIEFPPTNIIRDSGVYYFRKGGLQIIVSTVHQLQNLYFALTNQELTI